MAKRFPKIYPYGFKPTHSEKRLKEDIEVIIKKKKETVIFPGSMGDYFSNCDWIDKENPEIIYQNLGSKVIKSCMKINIERVLNSKKPHRFLFLTKNPEGYLRVMARLQNDPATSYIYREYFWFGSTIETNFLEKDMMRVDLLNELKRKYRVNTFVSYEPMLNFNDIYTFGLEDIDWIIMGALNNSGHPDFLNIDMVQAIKGISIVNEHIFLKDSIIKNIDSTNCDGSSLIKSYSRSDLDKIKEMRYIPWITKQQQ
jgi:hypothetical protein